MKAVNCVNCLFFEVVAKSGDPFVYMDPHGNEKTKTRDTNVSICRAMPPMNGWPLVDEDDWCGKFNPGEEVLPQ